MKAYEYVHVVRVGSLKVRAWCHAGHGFALDRRLQADQVLRRVESVVESATVLTAENVAEAVAGMPGCNRVEVCANDDEAGVLIYPDWP